MGDNDENFQALQLLNSGMEKDLKTLQNAVKAEYGDISTECAGAIAYLRGTSRWSALAEASLVLASRTGGSIPSVYAHVS